MEWRGRNLSKAINIVIEDLDVIEFSNQSSYRSTISRCNCPQTMGGFDKQVDFYINDVKSGAYIACQRLLKNEYEDYEGYETLDLDRIYLVKGEQKEVDEFVERVGIIKEQIHKISKLPKIPKKKRKKRIIPGYIFGTNNTFHCYNRQWWKEEEIDFDKGGVYLEFNNFMYVKGVRRCYPREANSLFERVKQLNIDIPTIYGIKTAQIGKIKKGKWTEFHIFLQEAIEDYFKKKNIDGVIQDCNTYNNLDENIKSYGILLETFFVKDGPISILRKELERLLKIHETQNHKLYQLRSLAESVGYEFPETTDKDIEKQLEAVEQKYPLLTMLLRGRKDGVDDVLIKRYIVTIK